MRLFGVFPVMGRRTVVALGVTGMLLMASAVQAQDPPPAQPPAQPAAAPAPPDPLKFENAELVILLWQIKPEKADDFAALIKELKAKMAMSAKPDVKAQGDGIKLLRVQTDPSLVGPAIFLLSLEPPSSTLSYDAVKMIYEYAGFTREEADALYKRLSEAHVQLVPWNIKKIG